MDTRECPPSHLVRDHVEAAADDVARASTVRPSAEGPVSMRVLVHETALRVRVREGRGLCGLRSEGV